MNVNRNIQTHFCSELNYFFKPELNCPVCKNCAKTKLSENGKVKKKLSKYLFKWVNSIKNKIL